MSIRTDRIDGVDAGMAIKVPAIAATTGNITLSGLQTIDSIVLTDGDRVLVKDQTNSEDNGIYLARANDWERASDFDGPRDITQGTRIPVYSGVVSAGLTYQVTASDDPIIINTTLLTFGLVTDVITSDPSALDYVYSSTTAMADPTSGKIRFNAAIGSATAIAISALTNDTGNPNIRTYINTWDDSTTTTFRGTLIVKKTSAPQNFAIYAVTSAVTDNVTWQQFTVSYIGGSGSFTDTDQLTVSFVRTGDKGAAGVGTGDVLAANYGTEYSGNYALLRQNIGSKIGTNVQAYDADLDAWAGLAWGADKMGYYTGAGAAALISTTAFGRSVLNAANAAALMALAGGGTAATLNVGTGANNIVQLDGSSKLPAVDGSQLTNLVAGSLIFLGSQTASASGSLDFTSLISATYDNYVFIVQDIIPASGGNNFLMRTSTDNGSSFSSGAANYDYAGNRVDAGTPTTLAVGAQATSMQLATDVSNTGLAGTITLINPLGTTAYKRVVSVLGFTSGTNGKGTGQNMAADRNSTAAINAVRFFMSSGNISSGIIYMYGVKKA